MKLDLSCPVEVRGYALSGDGEVVRASVRLYNLSRRRVAWLEGAAGWFSAGGRRMATPFRADRIRAAGESAFRISLETARLPDADRLELRFSRVGFDDGDEWSAGDGPFAELEPLPAIDPDELDALRELAGPDAVCYPRQTSQVWRCVCGRLNPNGEENCARCHRNHFAALACTPDAVRARLDALSSGRAAGDAPVQIPDAGAPGPDGNAARPWRATPRGPADGDAPEEEAPPNVAAPGSDAAVSMKGPAPDSAACGRTRPGTSERLARADGMAGRGDGRRKLARNSGDSAGEIGEQELAALHAQYLRQRARLLRRTAVAAALVLMLAVWFALRSASPEPAGSPGQPADEVMAED